MATQYSDLKIFYHQDRLEALRSKKPVAPIYVRLKPTNRCNHHCSYCSYGSGNKDYLTANRDQVRHADMIPWPKLQEIISDMGQMGVKALTFTGGGEPLSYPHILDAVHLAKARGIDVALITNGSLLSGEIASEFAAAKWVRVSFDNPNAEDYVANRGITLRDFDIVCKNIADFVKIKMRDCVLGINFVITKNNYKRIYEAAELLHGLGVNNVKFSGLLANIKGYHSEIKNEALNQLEHAQRDFSSESFTIINDYARNYEDRQIKPLSFTRCYICQLFTSICADSKVYYCFMRAYDSKAELGSLVDQSFKKLWFDESTQKKLLALNPALECRNQCVYDKKNTLIHSYFDIDQRHINFI